MSQQTFFYDAMEYPVPEPLTPFLFHTHLTPQAKPASTLSHYKKNSDQYQEFVVHLNKRGWIWKWIPCIEAVYICNSLSFNALKKNSDIDLVCITSPGCMRRARFGSAVILRILNLKRTRRRQRKKFCLTFYLDQHHQNIYSLRAGQDDVYLIYWIAHLHTRYQRTTTTPSFFSYNKRIQNFLPLHPLKQALLSSLKVRKGKTKFTQRIEKRFRGRCGRKIQYLIKYIRLPIMLYKTKKKNSKGIVISDTIQKFYHEKRGVYNMKIQQQKDTNRK